ncbi:MAG TPA: hypothetical protein VFN75_04090 [Pseudonocardiaceae bacterium]|nr:hypothetical protein [Pseudonocardiaceae bacterium]
MLGLVLGQLSLALSLPRLILRVLCGTSGLLHRLARVVRIVLGHPSLVFYALQVPLQLVDRQIDESALVLVALASLIPLAGVLLS